MHGPLLLWTNCTNFLSPPEGGLEAWLGVHITFVSGLFVVVVASTGVLALVPFEEKL